MMGHGFVYRWYRRTLLADDEEVAVAMAPAELGSAALGEALINMRLTLRHAERRGVVGRPAREALERLARSQHFLDRSYGAMIAAARSAMAEPATLAEIDALEGWLPGNAVDAKRADAIGLLRHLSGRGREGLPRPRSRFELTEAWAADLEAAGQWDDYLAWAGKSRHPAENARKKGLERGWKVAGKWLAIFLRMLNGDDSLAIL